MPLSITDLRSYFLATSSLAQALQTLQSLHICTVLCTISDIELMLPILQETYAQTYKQYPENVL